MFAQELSRTRSVSVALADYIAANPDPEIESYSAQYLTIVFYAEVESKVRDLCHLIFEAYSDKRIGTFLSRNQATILNRIKKSELSELASLFGDEVKTAFNDGITESEVADYNNVVLARHKVGHGPGVNVTPLEIKRAVDIAEKMLLRLHDILLPERK